MADLYAADPSAKARTTTTIHVGSIHAVTSQGTWRGISSGDDTPQQPWSELAGERQSLGASSRSAADNLSAISELTRLLSWMGLLTGLLLMWRCLHRLGSRRVRARPMSDLERDELGAGELATCIVPSHRATECEEDHDFQQEYAAKLRERMACFAEQQIEALAAATVATSSRALLERARFDDDDDFFESTILLPSSRQRQRTPGAVHQLPSAGDGRKPHVPVMADYRDWKR